MTRNSMCANTTAKSLKDKVQDVAICTIRILRWRRSMLGATTALDYHTWQQTVDDVKLYVKVEHGDSLHLAGCAAGSSASRLRHVPRHVRVRILAHESHRTLAWTVVGFVLLGSYDPVPAERLEVDCQRKTTATCLLAVLLAVSGSTLGTVLSSVQQVYLQERRLQHNSSLVNWTTGDWEITRINKLKRQLSHGSVDYSIV